MDRSDAPRAERRRLTHVDRPGRPRMVDVSAKPPTARRAVAEAEVAVSAETLSLVIDGGGAKGDVLTVAELAGVMGGKRTSELIPLCHPLALTDLVVTSRPTAPRACLRIRAEAATTGQTGVEMEAMTAASVAALTVYDMVKGVERGVEIRGVRLSRRPAARAASGTGRAPARAAAAARRKRGERDGRPDREEGSRDDRRRARARRALGARRSRAATAARPATARRVGRALEERLDGPRLPVERQVVPDDRARSGGARRRGAAHPLVVTTGGTGLTPRDVTPQATLARPRLRGARARRGDARRRPPLHAVRRAVPGRRRASAAGR